jgi:pullulanase
MRSPGTNLLINSRFAPRLVLLAVVLWVMMVGMSERGIAGADLASYAYAGDDLGVTYRPQQSVFKLWAPTAQTVSIMLFDSAAAEGSRSIPMQSDANGIWSATVGGNLDGKYYLYEIQREGGTVRVIDPYARGSSANSARALIYDSRKTDPDGWSTDRFVPLKHNVDAVLYEMHIRDFSINRNSGVSDANRGKYLGAVERGTKSPQGEKTGIDHLLELGITHVHLLPVFDYARGDEREKADDYTWYNWGYDPMLYNTPEGSYASEPDGTARQREFKQMVQAFHRSGIGVVMDVVYNHTFQTGRGRFSVFDKIVPDYYYRKDASGAYANASACGNEVATEKPMARRFIVDSIQYWMREYHVDGFRFDVMGVLDRQTMLEAFRAAKAINPNVIFYGEGWNVERVLPPEQMTTQRYVQGTGIAAFNDGIRDNIKGDAHRGAVPGFVQGATPPHGGMERFLLNIRGESTGKGHESIAVASPNESINYASCHDDYCLWDKLLLSAPNVPEQWRINMDKLAAGIVLTAQGVPFLHAGDEFLRSKNLNNNSYKDLVANPIDWSLKAKNRDVFEFYRGMIALRRAHPAFRMTERAAIERAVEFAKGVPENLVEYVIRNHANGDSWKNILVIYNGSKEARSLRVAGEWSIVADEKRAGTQVLRKLQNRVSVEPFSLLIAFTDGSFQLNEHR